MKDAKKTREQLINELAQTCQKIAELERLASHSGESEALLVSETRYRRLFESAQDGILILDGYTGQIADANPFVTDLLGYGREELLGKTLWEIGPFKDIKESKVAFRELQSKKYVRYEHLPLETKDGQRTSVEFVSNVYQVDGHRVIQCNIRDISARVRSEVESAEYKDSLERLVRQRTVALEKANKKLQQDITERKLAEEALRASREKLQRMFEAVTDAIVVTDLTGVIVEVNERAVRLHGHSSKNELLGKSVFALLAQHEHEKARENMQRTLTEGRLGGSECSLLRGDGSEFYGELSASVLNDAAAHPVGFITITRDITERKTAEDERQRMARLESIGTLAGGIAHDFNNLLTGILGNVQLAGRYVETGKMDRVSDRLLEAEKASIRAKDLTWQLLTFSKGGAPIKKVTSIIKLLKEVGTFNLAGSKSRAEFSLPDDLWLVDVDEGQMNQVISNIVINADQAMPEGGIVRISARNTVMKDGGSLPLKGNCVEIAFQDQGIGIRKEHLPRMFEPYFTTKQKGSGLGLATVHSIIKNHGGYATLKSKLGVGTTVYVYLPAATKPAAVEKEVAEEAPVHLGGRILVMDEEEMIRDFLYSELTDIGYEVELAEDGAEAIEKYAGADKSDQPFDAVILDLTVPGGMGGREVAKTLLGIDPNVKAIASSGYGENLTLSDCKQYGFSAVMAKPYSTKELEETVHKVLTECQV